jgi:LacI family transcriptional regulator
MPRKPKPDQAPERPHVTLRQVAEAAGVHFTTVSLALRNSPKLLPETRKRLQDLAREMGYRPDPMLAALNAYRISRAPLHFQATIAWINNWPKRDGLLLNREFREYYNGARARADELGYSLEEFWMHEPGMNRARLRRILKARGIQALLLPPQERPNTAPDIDFEEYSAVAFGFSMRPSVLHLVTNHHLHSMNLVLRKLYAHGYRRVGFHSGKGWNAKVDGAWLAAILTVRHEHPDLQVFSPILESSEALPPMEKWIPEHRLDAVVSYTEIIREVREAGFRVPEDIGFASVGLHSDEHTVTGVYQNDLLVGRKAVDLLVGMLHRNERGLPEVPVCTFVEGEWREGTTLLDRNSP